MNKCHKCTSNEWDYANVGIPDAILCTNCGEIYMMKDETTMTNNQKLIDTVLHQIVLDVQQGDLTAIEEMLGFLPKTVLLNFISAFGLPLEVTE